MRIEQRHHHREALVGRADHAHAPVRFGRVLHQPIDGVLGVGRVVGRRGVERAADRPGHQVVALGPVLAAHVLEDADVAARDEYLVALRQDGQHVGAVVAGRALGGVIGRAGQQNRRVLGPLGTTITVCSFTPSRMGIITSRFVVAAMRAA